MDECGAVLGGAESFIVSGALVWGLALVGLQNTGKFMSWVGMVIIKATTDRKNVFYLGVSEDDPRDKHLLTGSGRVIDVVLCPHFFLEADGNGRLA